MSNTTDVHALALNERAFAKLQLQITRVNATQETAAAVIAAARMSVAREEQRLHDLVTSVADASDITLPVDYDVDLDAQTSTLTITPGRRTQNGHVLPPRD